MTTDAPTMEPPDTQPEPNAPVAQEPLASTDASCVHCGLPIPDDAPVRDDGLRFCCHGCEAVYAVLHDCGLDAYYRLREELEEPDAAGNRSATNRKPRASNQQRFVAFDADSFLSKHVKINAQQVATARLRLDNVRCGACVWLIERLPRLVPGVIECRMGTRHTAVRITWDAGTVKLSRIVSMLDRLGYPARPDQANDPQANQAQRDATRRQLTRIGWAGACAANTMLLAIAMYAGAFADMSPQFHTLFRVLSALIGLVALLGPGRVFFHGAWAALRTRTANLDLPIALALAVGGVAGLVNTVTGNGDLYFDSLSVLVFLLLVARYLQSRQKRWADETLGLMMGLTPMSCRRLGANEQREEVPVDALKPNDVVEVCSGELIPADGVVSHGQSSVDQALLTGESVATPVGTGDHVYAGTSNQVATLQVRVSRVGTETRVGQLMRLVHEGVGNKPAIVQQADRIAGVFVVAVSLIAAAVFVGWWWLGGSIGQAASHSVALLIVACPCALAVATPLTLAVASARAAKQGILIKNADALELLTRGGRAWFDKTGTLTQGHTVLAEWSGPEALRGVVAAVERESIHPIGRALVSLLDTGNPNPQRQFTADLSNRSELRDGGVSATFQGQPLHVGSRRFIAKQGIEINPAWAAKTQQHEQAGHTVVLVALNKSVQALAALGDRVKPEAKPVIEACRNNNWSPGIMSGDAQAVVTHVASALSLAAPDALGNLLPEEKLDTIRANTSPNHKQHTMMIGDGVNDAAALAAADIGIAVQGGAEAAMAAADIYLADHGIAQLPELFRLSTRTRRVILINLALSLTYNATAVSLAAAGVMSPLLAAVLMPISSGLALLVAVGGQTGGSLRSSSLAHWK